MTTGVAPHPFDGDEVYVIAEIGVNHNGSVDLAVELIDHAADAGADAAKFQTFVADELVTTEASRAPYQDRNTGDGASQYEMLRRLELGEADFAALAAHCRARGIEFMSTPFSESAADLLERVGVEVFKVSSGDLTHLGLLRHLAALGRPLILSTGMAGLAEVERALAAISDAGDVPTALLHCVSDYPALAEDCNLSAMATLSSSFGRPVGWSDHTVGSAVSIAAVALGAKLIEKHITLDVTMDGPDHAASMPPAEFRNFVSDIRQVERALGDGIKQATPRELVTAEVARRSIVAVRDLEAGRIIDSSDVAIKRPGTGLGPELLDLVVGSRLGRPAAANEPITVEHLHHG